MEGISEIRAYRIRREIDNEIERWSEQDTDLARGVVLGLMKARILLFTRAESVESERTRREMFG